MRDTNDPTVSITRQDGLSTDLVAGSAVPIDIVLNEDTKPVVLTAGSFTLTGGGSIATIQRVSARKYTAIWTLGSTAGANTILLKVNQVRDLADNGNVISPALSITATLDATDPTVVITRQDGLSTDLVAGSAVPIDIVLNEDTKPVVLTAGSFTLTGGGSIATIQRVSARKYTAIWTLGSTAGANTILLKVNQVRDLADNGNVISPALSITATLDATDPTVVITRQDGLSTDLVAGSAVPIDIVLNEDTKPVVLTAGSFTLTGGGSIATIQRVSARKYTAIWTLGSTAGANTILLKVNQVRDLADNGNVISPALSITATLDATDPTVVITRQDGLSTDLVAGSAVPIDIVLNEDTKPVVLTAGSFTLTGGGSIATIQRVSARKYTAIWTLGSTAGANTILLKVNQVRDLADNGNVISPALSITATLDATDPTVVITRQDGLSTDLVAGSAVPIDIVLNEDTKPVVLTAGSFTLTGGGSIATIQRVSARKYTAIWTLGSTAGANTILLKVNQVRDLADNGNVISPALSITATLDATDPTVVITRQDGLSTDLVAGSAVPIDIVLNEDTKPVVLTAGSFTLTGGGSIATIQRVSARKYTAIWTLGSTAGANTILLKVNQVRDLADNGNVISPALSITATLDTINPTATITRADGSTADVSTGQVIAIDIVFSEDIQATNLATGINAGSGITISNVQRKSARYYTALATVLASGNLTVDLVAGAATDTSGRLSDATTPGNGGQLLLTRDNGKPVVIISSPSGSYGTGTKVPITFTFTRNIANFQSASVTVGGADQADFRSTIAADPTNPRRYTGTLTVGSGDPIYVYVPVSAATDTTGNSNDQPATNTITRDVTVPKVTITRVGAGSIGTGTVVRLRFSFDRDVTDFENGPFTISTGEALSITATESARSYIGQFTVSSSSANMVITAPAGAATDVLSRYGNQQGTIALTRDVTLPRITSTSKTPAVPNKVATDTNISVTFNFDKDIKSKANGGFGVGSVKLQGATLKDIILSGGVGAS